MDKSQKLTGFGIMALVFVVYYYLSGSQDAIGSTLISIVLVGFASVLTHFIIREQRKKGRISAQ